MPMIYCCTIADETLGAKHNPTCLAAKPQHTPTPWEAHEDWNKTVELFGGSPPDKSKNITNILSWEDAAFIVRAVNAHEVYESALLEIARFDPTKLDAATLGNIARKALSAEGK